LAIYRVKLFSVANTSLGIHSENNLNKTLTLVEFITPALSIIAVIISLATAWLTIFRRGSLHSTHPSLIAFCYDKGPGDSVPLAKIFLRTLLYSTGKRGHVIEGLYLRLTEGSRHEEFSFWGHGETNNLTRGSGLFIPETGLGTNHHFNPVHNDVLFRFSQGTYKLELFAKIVGQERPRSLWSIDVDMPVGPFSSDIDRDTEVFFNWSLEHRRYIADVQRRR
jgi:hypothetical protein